MAAIEVIGFGAMNIDRVYRVDSIVADGDRISKCVIDATIGWNEMRLVDELPGRICYDRCRHRTGKNAPNGQ